MTPSSLVRALALCAAFAFSICLSAPASAECTEARVKKLSKQGKTVAAIAKSCEMSKKAVQAMLAEDEEEDDDEAGGKPAGTPVGQCGCWGPINPGHRQPEPSCKSGLAKPRMCNAMCPMGGYMWRGVCA